MAEVIMITGGSRSGKSAFAQQLAEEVPGTHLFVATCPVTDDEMAARIARHVADRSQSGWATVEEQTDIAEQLHCASGYDVILVDCLTLWVNNLMYAATSEGNDLTEDAIADPVDKLAMTARNHPGRVIFVTNEVGLGIVPENQQARLFRDLVGRCNQLIAAAADRVFLVSCGIPLQIKG